MADMLSSLDYTAEVLDKFKQEKVTVKNLVASHHVNAHNLSFT